MLVIAGEKSHGNQSYKCAFNFMYYKDFWVVKVKKGGALIWEKTFGGPYLEQADDIVNLQDGGFGIIGAKCSHNYDISSCRSVAKVLYVKIDSDGNLMEEKSWSGLEFFERLPYFSITNTSIGGISWTAEHKRKGTWIHKWGPNEDTVNVYTVGNGGFDINRTEDIFGITTFRNETGGEFHKVFATQDFGEKFIEFNMIDSDKKTVTRLMRQNDEIWIQFNHYQDGKRFYKYDTRGFAELFDKNCTNVK